MIARKLVVLGIVVMAGALVGGLALQAGATSQVDADVQSVDNPQQQIELPDNQESFTVESVSAPDSIGPDTTGAIAAVVENPNSDREIQPVEIRIDGDVVARERVGIDGESDAVVSFDVDASEVDAGTSVYQVLTPEDGAQGELTVSESFTVSELEAPESVTQGDSVTVNATVTNPNDDETTQTVAVRFDGTPLVTEELTIEGDESTEFSAEIDSVDAEAGTYTHGVYTRDAGATAQITVEEPTAAEVSFSDQESNGTTVTVDSVNVSDGGFVVIHDDSLLEGNVVGSVIGVSDYLEPGEQEDVEVTLFDVPGGEFDESELTENQTLIAMPHLDTNDNETYDFVTSEGAEDGPYTEDGEAVTDSANVTVSQAEAADEDDDGNVTEEATVSFSDQQSDGTTVTVDSVNVSDGGFVVIHDDSLLEGNVVGSVIGVSDYLEPGEQEDVEVELFDVPGGEFDETELTENQTLIAMPHLDTNDNETYDFVTSEGAEDGPYTEDGEAVTDSANVTVENETETPEDTPAETPEDTPTESPEGTPSEPPGETPPGATPAIGNATN